MNTLLKNLKNLKMHISTQVKHFFVFLSTSKAQNIKYSLIHQRRIVFNPKRLEINTPHIFYYENSPVNSVNSAWIELRTSKEEKENINCNMLHTLCLGQTLVTPFAILSICYDPISHRRLPKNLKIKKMYYVEYQHKKQFQYYKFPTN